MQRPRLIILLLLACAIPAIAEEWSFAVPTVSRRSKVVDADWRPYDRIEVPLTRVDGGKGPVSCRVFFETKQELWFESVGAVECGSDGETQVLSLRLDELSPDWRCKNGRRSYGPDVLGWVSRWGVQVAGEKGVAGKITIGPIRLVAAENRDLVVKDVDLPTSASAGDSAPIRFRLENFRGNPFDATQIAAKLVCTGGDGEHVFPFYFKQDYVELQHPGSGLTVATQSGRPVWQADAYLLKAGTYSLELHLAVGTERITKELGDLKVGRSESARVAGATPPTGTEFARVSHDGPILECRQYPEWTKTGSDGALRFWQVPLDWTSDWGHYTGAGEFDQLIAWRFDQVLSQFGRKAAMPVLLFSEDELDDQGKYNWKDHPLRRGQGGSIERPSEVFTSEEVRRVLIDRARYLVARYGGNKGFGGLLILTRRPEPEVRHFIDWLTAQIQDEFPGTRIVANNPELSGRLRSEEMELGHGWQADVESGPKSRIRKDKYNGELILRGRYPGSCAAVINQVQHLAGVDALAFDVITPPVSGNGFKMQCSLRVAADTVFQSKLLSLRPDHKNRALFSLKNLESWTCLQDESRKMKPYDLLNCKQLGVRFFCDERETEPLRLANALLLWPLKSDAVAAEALAISALKLSSKAVRQYEKLEFQFLLNRAFRNPYDPKQIDVSIEVTDPTGETRIHPGFFDEPFALVDTDGTESVKRSGQPSWKVRIAPSLVGTHEWKIVARAGDEESTVKGVFVSLKGKSHGYVRTSEKDPHWLEFEDGEFFYPIGHNLRSPRDTRAADTMPSTIASGLRAEREGTMAYAKWFKKMHENGANFARVWMSSWWLGLEWNQTTEGYHGLEYYNQSNAARLDRLIELAEKEGVYLCLETINHGMLSSHIDKQWAENPANKETQPGGYLCYATEYFSSERANEWHRNKMRYTVARWGYSTSIAWWGVVTEAEWVEPYFRSISWVREGTVEWEPWIPRPYKSRGYRAMYQDWISDMAGYMKEVGMHPHMTSVHFSNPYNGLGVWRKPDTDIVHNNAYTMFASWFKTRLHSDRSTGVLDLLRVYGDLYEPYSRKKPLLVGEWGGSPHTNTATHLTAEFHTGMWSMLMSRMSGVTGFWWWSVLDTADLYEGYRPVASFMAGEDRRGKDLVSQSAKFRFTDSSGSRRSRRHGLTLAGSNELMAYICIEDVNKNESSVVPKGFADGRFPESGPGELTVPRSVAAGIYKVEYWNTFTGKVIESTEVSIGLKRTIPIISHRVDLAIKMKPASL